MTDLWMIVAIVFCGVVQLVTFAPFYLVWRQDKKKYGDDLAVPLKRRFTAWLVMFPIWAIPFAVMIGERF